MINLTLKDAMNEEARKKNKEGANDSSQKKLHIMIVQDAENVQSFARSIAEEFEKQNLGQLTVEEFFVGRNLRDYLEDIKDDKTIIPDAFILDSGGGGATLGVSIARWFDEHRPDAPLPKIDFLSLATDSAVDDCAVLKARDERIDTDFISLEELIFLNDYLKKGESKTTPITNSLRKLLNERLDSNLPLDIATSEYDYHKKEYDKKLQSTLLDGYSAGNVNPSIVIKSCRNYAMNLAKSLQSGLYNAQGEDVKSDASFYEGTGVPIKGTAVFSLKEVEEWSSDKDDKPILIMQSYDPKVVPLLSTGKLGGIVLCGPYLAAHLSMLCEANKVSGVFGLVPPDSDGLSDNFNEMAQSHLNPYFDKPETDINGTTINEGQKILIGIGNNGVAYEFDTITDIQNKIKETENNLQELSPSASTNLRQISHCFKAFFSKHKAGHHKVKANADSIINPLLSSAYGIGLIRSEQIAGSNEHQAKALRDILLDEDQGSYDILEKHSKDDYAIFLMDIEEHYPVKIRLFDISPKDLLSHEDQKKFHEKYGSMDIHGGKALETWPKLYREQVKTILQAYDKVLDWNNGAGPVQIMMPAIRTEKETLHIKGIVEEEAQRQKLKQSHYQFGVMIETIDSCDNAADITKHCDFISFGTNDLTQQVLNIPRDDLRSRKKYEKEHGFDPFKKLAPEVLDRIRDVCAIARKANPEIEIDICGGQASDFDTAQILFDAGVDNLSVAPSRANLIALPLLLNYQMFDKIEKQPTVKTQIPKQKSTNTQ